MTILSPIPHPETLLGVLLAGFVAFLLLALLHCVCQAVHRGKMGLLRRYVAGTAAIGVVYGAWCLCQPTLPGWLAFLGWAAVALGAGFGTTAGHALDHWSAQRREIRYLRGSHEQPAPRPARED